MSHWGKNTGYLYESQRVAFLREMYRTEKRAALHQAFGVEDGDEIDVLALVRPLPPLVVSPRNSLPSTLPPLSASRLKPSTAPMTTSQMAFRTRAIPTGLASTAFGRSRGDIGRARNKETEYREHVFQ
jgi:hypothetical protein